MIERLQKVLARGGLGSRRSCEELIAAKRVKVNGVVASEPGVRVDPAADEVTVDGVLVEFERPVYVLLNKPKGFVCTNRPTRGERSAVDLVTDRGGPRLFCVGRLDEESNGALILSNDGEFCNLVTHPRYGVAKTYRVVVHGKVEGDVLGEVQHGIHLSEGKTSPARVQVVKRTRNLSILRMTLREGKNRHIRRVFARVGFPVKEITRIAIGPVQLGRLPSGSYRLLSAEEVRDLTAAASRPTEPERRRGPRRR